MIDCDFDCSSIWIVVSVLLGDLLQPLGGLLLDFERTVFIVDFGFEGLSLAVGHGDINNTIGLESGDVKAVKRSTADLLSHEPDVVHQLIVFVLD